MDFFNKFSKIISRIIGSSWAFFLAFLSIILWIVSGPFFKFSDTWQLIINTGTTIITFLIVFLIQHTQNRDTDTIQIKLDELIRGIKAAKNERIAIDELTDEELKNLEKKYKELAKKRRQ
jgi:low affinity Fe/Cu permease